MFGVKFSGLRIESTLSANIELLREDMDLYDFLEVLERGYEVKTRKNGILEKSLRKGKKEIKVVVSKKDRFYEGKFTEEVWILIHVGKFTYKKRRKYERRK